MVRPDFAAPEVERLTGIIDFLRNKQLPAHVTAVDTFMNLEMIAEPRTVIQLLQYSALFRGEREIEHEARVRAKVSLRDGVSQRLLIIVNANPHAMSFATGPLRTDNRRGIDGRLGECHPPPIDRLQRKLIEN